MAIYYDQQLIILQGKQARKDREFAEEISSRKLHPSEQKVVDEVMNDLLQMQFDDIHKINRDLDASIAESKARIAKLDSLSASRRISGRNLVAKHYNRALENGRKEGRAISSSNGEKIQSHIDTVRSHASGLMSSANDLATILQGSETPYAGNDPGRPDSGQQEGKYGRNGLNYETKSLSNNKQYRDAYELKRDLPLKAQKEFMDEYNQTPYGQEKRLMNKYVERYSL